MASRLLHLHLRRRGRGSPTTPVPPLPLLLAARLLSSSSSAPSPAAAAAAAGAGIEKVLVANRGEIACRVMRTARRLGVATVAVYSDADRGALHVRAADEAVRIGPPPARESYLNAKAIIDAAHRTGAQAIHPGYGFLSESADFAQLCEAEGLKFIGPPASAIRDMGDKSASKRIMGAAGVPLVPGYHGAEQDIELLKLEADKIGYPVLIKPTHGGGGKGMRIVQRPDEFVDSVLSAQREAAASFGVNTLLIEKYITQPRHVEVQVFGDQHGNVIYLYERDCSLQRRHQKIIEEAPAPNVTAEFRSHIGGAAVSAAKAVGYYNAGTVEFIVDTLSGKFYFMEMNTRLQVEHPVTEMIVSQDLVEWQIRVANGERLPLSQEQVPLNGHAFEARIYAENVPRGFLPATGTLHHYRPVPSAPTVRVETGVEEGDTVSMHYDPMIAKLVVWGESRSAALVKLKNCLSNFQIAGLPTNVGFLQELASHSAFEEGIVDTHFIERYKDDLLSTSTKASGESDGVAELGAILAAACICKKDHITSKESIRADKTLSVWYNNMPFRMHHFARQPLELELEEHDGFSEKLLKLFVTYKCDGSYFIETEEGTSGFDVKVDHKGDHDFRVDAAGLQTDVTLAYYSKDNSKHIHVWHGKHHHHYRQTLRAEHVADDSSQPSHASEGKSHPKGSVLAPMAGLVVKVLLEDGAQVEAGQPVMVMEAMKMEHVVKAPRAGYVEGLKVTAGQQVFDSSVLFTIKHKLLQASAAMCPQSVLKGALISGERKAAAAILSVNLIRRGVVG
ncbi:methylcrotonoyl-CoA carboxylase subunit alpha, mitochondrial [Panicum miliaceum]|uniref:Methylcrotonoyl-CoA carboxylase subunit alpha, mitochondrial n=1 Tax=Panicum miliaceum TaxID=4540 RepID=A0A3L6RB57_PANMI|nr:methylcrotonoyl-CoA carboxylase subunit alpha, mitochondrial [Panicum miliaceum]